MASQITRPGAPKESKLTLVCRLRHKVSKNGLSPTAGEVELENVSPRPIEIQVSIHPLQYLNLIITDEEGVPIPARPYSNLFSPRDKPFTFRIELGEKYKHNVSLLGTIPEEQQQPGIYLVRAAYECQGMKVMSDPLQVEIPPREG